MTTAHPAGRRALWPLAARALWLTILVLVVVVFVLGQSVLYPWMLKPCADSAAACHPALQVKAADAQALAALGWSLSAYALVTFGVRLLVRVLGVGLGALLFWRRPDDRMTLIASLFLMIGLEATVSDALVAVYPAWWLPTRVLAFTGGLCFALFFYLFPSGHFVPRWTRWPAGVWAAAFVGIFFFPDSAFNLNLAPPWAAGPVIFGLLGSFIVAQVYRYRAVSTPIERLQTKWVVFASVLGLTGLVLALLSVLGRARSGTVITPFWILTGLGFQLSEILIPLAIAVAVFRYRLFDIDVIIRRTLIYSVLTALLALAYFGSVLVLQNVFQALTGEGQNALATVLSTLTIAALFGPLRGRVQRAIDRRFFRQKYDAARTLAAFGAQARDVVELDLLSEELVGAVEATMQPAHVRLWVKPSDTPAPR